MNRIFNALVARQSALARHAAKGLEGLAGNDGTATSSYARNYCTPIGKDIAAYHDPATTVIDTDSTEMSASFVVTKVPANILDRDGDIMAPLGCRLQNYSLNPICMFDHREMNNLPIGKCRKNRTSPVTVWPTENDVRCKIYFSQRTQLGTEIYGLVEDDVLVAVSPGFIPIRAEKLPHSKAFADNPATPRYNILEYDLFEISVCGVPVNPEALRVQMSRGRIRTDWLRKSLAAYAQPAKVMSHGAELPADTPADPEPEQMSTPKIAMPAIPANVQAVAFAKSTFTNAKARAWLKAQGLDDSLAEHTKDEWVFLLADEVTGTRTKSLAAGITATLAKGKRKKAEEPEDEDEKDSDDDAPKKKPAKDSDEEPQVAGTEEEEETEERAEEAEEPVETKDEARGNTGDADSSLTEKENAQLLKPGAMALIDLAGHHAGVKAYLDTAAHHIEGPERVVQHMEDEAEHASKRHDAAEKCFNKCYPQHKGEFANLVNKPEVSPSDDDKPDDASKAVTGKVAKAALAAIRKAVASNPSPVKDAAEFLAELGTMSDLPATVRAGVQFHANALGSVMQSAIEQPGPGGEETVPAFDNNTPGDGPAAPNTPEKKDEAPGGAGAPPNDEDEEKETKAVSSEIDGLRKLLAGAGVG